MNSINQASLFMPPPAHMDSPRIFLQAASALVTLTGAAMLLGWLIDNPAIQSFMPSLGMMKFNAGVGFLLTGMAMCVLGIAERNRGLRWSGMAVASMVLLLGIMTLGQYVDSASIPSEQFTFAEDDADFDPMSARRMAGMALLTVLMIVAALRLNWKKAPASRIEYLTIFAAVFSLTPVAGYLADLGRVDISEYYEEIFLHSALAYMLLCCGILAVRPPSGYMVLITHGGDGRLTAHRVFPAAVIVPLAVGWLILWMRQTALYDTLFALTLLGVTSMVLFTVLIRCGAGRMPDLPQRLNAEGGGPEAATLSGMTAALQAEVEHCRRQVALLENENAYAKVTLKSVAEGVITTDTADRIVYLNPAAEKMTGWSLAEAVGRPFKEVVVITDAETREFKTEHGCLLTGSDKGNRFPKNTVLLNREGRVTPIENSCAPIHDRAGRRIGSVTVCHDVGKLRALTSKMVYLAQHDALTHLPNRVLLNDRLVQAVAMAMRRNQRAALLFLDLDHFKHVNDTLGHHAGDLLLIEVAHRLERCMRDTDTISRQGGDEFIILLHEVADSFGAARAASQVLAAISEPFFIEDHELHLTGSIGISICPEDGRDAETIVKHADAAMYHAKALGRNSYQFFAPHINEQAMQRSALENGLRSAIARNRMELHYQPKINILTGTLIGAEALMRWSDQENGLISPAQLIPIAEECGLISSLGEWVLRTACRQNRDWQDAGYPPMPISVNVSAVQLRGRSFLETVNRILRETALEPRYLELEFTENIAQHDMESVISLLSSLKKLGVRVSLDDFGTGLASLSHLKRFPVDTLKIDQSFIHGLTVNSDDAAITGAIIGMAKKLKHKVIAEGVETYEQLAILSQQGCGEIQGFYVSEALPADAFEQRIFRGRLVEKWVSAQACL